jgi:hypothetical protein
LDGYTIVRRSSSVFQPELHLPWRAKQHILIRFCELGPDPVC